MTADILCDASSLISLTRSCFDNVLSYMHNAFDLRFFISPSVEGEIITRPLSLKSKQYALSALRLKNMINRKIIIRLDADLRDKAEDTLNVANKIFFVKGKPINIIHMGEIEIVVLSKHLGINSLLLDERTTRMLIESPFKYKKHLEKEFRVNVMLNKKNLSIFQKLTQDIKIIRSSELLIIAYENGLFDNLKSLRKDTLSAGLYNLKYSGCAIRYDEIERFMKRVN